MQHVLTDLELGDRYNRVLFISISLYTKIVAEVWFHSGDSAPPPHIAELF